VGGGGAVGGGPAPARPGPGGSGGPPGWSPGGPAGARPSGAGGPSGASAQVTVSSRVGSRRGSQAMDSRAAPASSRHPSADPPATATSSRAEAGRARSRSCRTVPRVVAEAAEGGGGSGLTSVISANAGRWSRAEATSSTRRGRGSGPARQTCRRVTAGRPATAQASAR
jgi:hypothetical protein